MYLEDFNYSLPKNLIAKRPTDKRESKILICNKKKIINFKNIFNELDKDDVFGTVEAVKTVSDLFLPMSGKIIEFNENLSDAPESINDSPYDEGWIIKVEVSNPDEISELLDNNQYKELIG